MVAKAVQVGNEKGVLAKISTRQEINSEYSLYKNIYDTNINLQPFSFNLWWASVYIITCTILKQM